MKTKNLFFMVCLVVFGGIIKGNAQLQPSVFLGPGAGANNGTATDNTGLGANALNLNDTVGNTAVGAQALQATGIYPAMTSPCANNPAAEHEGSYNTAVGSRALVNNLIGRYNCALGQRSLEANTVGYGNVALGRRSLESNVTGCGNVAVGYGALLDNDNSHNIAVGNSSPRNFSVGGNFNIFIGDQTAQHLTTGNFNTIIGSFIDVDHIVTNPLDPFTVGTNTNNTVILADGQGNQRLLFSNRGFGGVGLGNNVKPQNTFDIRARVGSPTQAGFTASGLRLSSLPNLNFNPTPPTSNRQVLSVNGNGDVILVDDEVGTTTPGITNSCGKEDFVTLDDGSGNLICSQIYDNIDHFMLTPRPLNGSSVCIGTLAALPASFFQFTWSGGLVGSTLPPTSGTVKLNVRGITRSNAYIATSDANYKLNINDLYKPLETVLKLQGRSYNWDVANNPEMNFDDGDHTGFIAQEIEKVLPHVVINQDVDSDKYGKVNRKSVNYTEIIPYLVEAIKAQQLQIECLMEKVGCNPDGGEEKREDKAVAIKFANTKIINVAPNPSKDVVAVSLNVEEGIDDAILQVHDINGRLLSSLNVKERGNDFSKSFQKDNFGTGVYIVSLVVNGKSIDAKRIIFE